MAPITSMSFPHFFPEKPAQNLGTDAKIERVWQASSAALALFSALLLGIMGPPSLVLSASLATLSFLWIRDLSPSIDFQDPDVLNQVRDNAGKMSLAQMVDAYGWSPLFRYEILTPDRFYALFIAHVETLPIKSLIAFNEMAARELAEAKRKGAAFSFKIPHPSRWKQKFHDETKGLSCTAILAAYPVEKLAEYQIIDEKEKEIFDKVRNERALFAAKQRELEEECLRRTEPFRKLLKCKEDLAKAKYDPGSIKRDLSDLYWNYSQQIGIEEAIAKGEGKPSPAAVQALRLRKEALFQGYLSAKSSLERRLAFFDSLQIQEKGAARLEFHLATQPIRDEIDQRTDRLKTELSQTLSSLDQERGIFP